MSGNRGRAAVALAAFCLTGRGAAASYKPPVAPEPSGIPAAWIAQRADTKTWCTFDRMERMVAAIDAGTYEANGRAAVRLRNGRLDSIRIQNESEDAAADDVYRFDQKRRIVRLTRTGHYIPDPLFSVVYEPDAKGRLVLTAASRTMVKRMEAAGYEPYIVDWEKYGSFGQMPFRALVTSTVPETVRPGCRPER